MPVPLKVPNVGESITEVEIGQWLKNNGDVVRENDPVVVIETEKATLEIPAPISGKISEVLKKAGDKAAVGEVIGYMESASVAPTDGKPPVKEPPVQEPPKQDPPRHEPPPQEPPKQEPPRQEPPAEEPPKQEPPAPQSSSSLDRGERLVPMSPIRRRIAERLVEAQKTAALLTTFNEVDMSSITELRTKHKEAFHQKHGAKLGIVSFFVRAAIVALKEIPQLNGEIRGDNIVYKDFYDIGIAIGGGKGLVVPVLRNAERLNFGEMEKAITDFAKRAADNQLKVEELQGGTFTISNGGIYGSLMSTPIVNPPQSGVLGLHAITDRPVARGGQVVIRPMMYVALTYDHRIVDGREAVTFLKRVKDLIEDPALLLIDI
ncbi:MAG TPA: dihydrolipoyllysine-residue succinyltransferase [Terriglobia bacterium]|nr:dihydrolipoyllysine-residue succinyltransferase [Terriglobia bacterium]